MFLLMFPLICYVWLLTCVCVQVVQKHQSQMTMNLSSVSQLLEDMENWDKENAVHGCFET